MLGPLRQLQQDHDKDQGDEWILSGQRQELVQWNQHCIHHGGVWIVCVERRFSLVLANDGVGHPRGGGGWGPPKGSLLRRTY